MPPPQNGDLVPAATKENSFAYLIVNVASSFARIF